MRHLKWPCATLYDNEIYMWFIIWLLWQETRLYSLNGDKPDKNLPYKAKNELHIIMCI